MQTETAIQERMICRYSLSELFFRSVPFETQLLQSVILFSDLISITVTVTVIIFPEINYITVINSIQL